MTAAAPLVICPIPIAQGGEALRLAAAAWPESERAGQLAMIASRIASGHAEELLLEARRGDQLLGAALAQRLAGKTAVVWLPQPANAEQSIQHALLEALCARLADEQIHLAQAVLDTTASPGAELLAAGGFQHSGDLLYMAAPAESFPSKPPSSPLSFHSYSPAAHERLLSLVEATYQGSLDCPLIDGLRDTADVLDGYRAVGQPRPEWWLIARLEGHDVGCLLLADHLAENQCEIVYAGIVPGARGRRFGLALTRHAQWLAHKAGKSRLVLAVDAANAPAIAMYEAAGCIAWDRRSVFVRPLCRGANHRSSTS
jgi:ribosomal protein S18 acetylase RimI-like enzyme